MSEDTTTSLIVVLQGNKDIEKYGKIIVFGSGANVNTVRGLAAEKLDIPGSTAQDDIILRDGNGRILEGIDDVRKQQVVHVDVRQRIKEVIPGPRKLPFVGSLPDLLPDMTRGFQRLFEIYGPLISVSILGNETITTNDPAIAELFVKESEYFTKRLSIGLKEIREFAGTGLFTSSTEEHEWKLAHKLLMPAFSPRAIKAYGQEMGLIAQETIRVLEQFSPEESVDIVDWTTRLTFETIGRIGFGYEFGMLQGRDAPLHPFIQAMAYCLNHAIARIQEPAFMKRLPLERNRRFDRDRQLMNDIVDQVIAERKNSPDAKDMHKDLLGFMLNARDEHDLGLSDENVRYQVVTFLIAGHDTTANTLAWALYELSRHPDVEQKMLQEIVNVGITHDKLPTVEQISQLKYMHQVLKETLRRYPPVRTIGKYCKKDCVVPGGYKIKAGSMVSVNIYSMHLNPKVYPDPYRFDPDRWTPEEEQKRSRFAWLPFSTGPRACIGQAFALQEAKIVLAMLLHRFKFTYDGPEVNFSSKAATTKPVGLLMHIHPRTDLPSPSTEALQEQASKPNGTKPAAPQPETLLPQINTQGPQVTDADLPSVTFLYGTQTGTAQDYASQLASQARAFGFKKVTLCEMDKWQVLQTGRYEKKNKDPQDLVVICTATYNGQPPDSAEKFDKFMTEKTKESGNEKLFDGLQYAVFGVGNKNWRTYQAFPIKVNQALEDLGADRFFSAGEGNADKDMDADFNEWCAHFWVRTLSYYGLAVPEQQSIVPTASVSVDQKSVKVRFISPSDKAKWEAAQANRNGEYSSKILVNKELQQPGSGRSTRHIEIDISNLHPLGEKHYYEAGDHLEVMPENDQATVEAVAISFGWVLDSVFEIDPEEAQHFKPRSLAASIKGPCTVRNMLTHYADLSSPPSRTMLAIFAQQLSKTSPETAAEFNKLIMPDSELYAPFIEKHRTLLDLQRAFPQVNQLELGQFLTAVGVMQPRRYSIACSPLVHPKQAHLAVAVVHDVLKDGRDYYGLASSYLARVQSGATVRATLKSSKSSFGLPSNPAVPIILISAGTGISPFRGFLQERAYQRKVGEKVGKCVVLFGCRRRDHDFIYADELEEYIQSGVISKLHVAFSRQQPPSPIKYVQHQILANAAEIWALLHPTTTELPADVYVCGSGAMSRDVRRAFCTMAKSFGEASTDQEAENYLQKLLDEGRYSEDVWG